MIYVLKIPNTTFSLLSLILLLPNLFSNARLPSYINRLAAGKKNLYWTDNPTFLNN